MGILDLINLATLSQGNFEMERKSRNGGLAGPEA